MSLAKSVWVLKHLDCPEEEDITIDTVRRIVLETRCGNALWIATYAADCPMWLVACYRNSTVKPRRTDQRLISEALRVMAWAWGTTEIDAVAIVPKKAAIREQAALVKFGFELSYNCGKSHLVAIYPAKKIRAAMSPLKK